jgi:hypothetical protein
MSALQPAFSVPFAAMIIVAALVMAVTVRRVRAHARARRRVVERPNSHYTSQLVRDGEARHRWQNIPLEHVHEVNRGEVVRLLGKVEAGGIESLAPGERVFLDQFVPTAAPESPLDPPARSGSVAPDLRHRPA